MSNETIEGIAAAAAVLRQTAETLESLEVPETHGLDKFVRSPQGHTLVVHADGHIRLIPPGIEPADEGGWTWSCPGGLWDTLERMAGVDSEEAAPLTRRQKADIAAKYLAELAGDDGMDSVEGMADPDVLRPEDMPDAPDPPDSDSLPRDLATGEYVLVSDPELADVAQAIADRVAEEELRDGMDSADLERVGRFKNRAKALRAQQLDQETFPAQG